MAKKRKKKTKNNIPIYRSYRFSGQDPAVSDVLHMIRDDVRTHEDSLVSRSTVRNWRSKKTRRPQHATMEAVLRANGKRFVIGDL